MPQTPRNQKTFYTLSNVKKHIAQTNDNTSRVSTVEAALPSYIVRTGDTMTGHLNVPDEAWADAWDGDLTVPTKNALYDKLDANNTFVRYTSTDGALSFPTITDNLDGTVDVGAVTVALRSLHIEHDTSIPVKIYDISETLNLALTDNSINYIYAEYNSGTPQVVADTIDRGIDHTEVLLGSVFREGFALHIDLTGIDYVGDFFHHTLDRLEETHGFHHVSGAALSETGTRNFAVSVGGFWRKLNHFNSPAIDTSGTDTFSYYYGDGVGGWTEVTAQTQIDNLQYDDGTGVLATLSNNQWGVHFIYGETDGSISVLYGSDSYNKLIDAQAALPPSSVPDSVSFHGILVGKIIILKSAIVFADIQSAFVTPFQSSGVTSHLDLADIGTNTHAQIDTHIASAVSKTGTPLVNQLAYYLDANTIQHSANLTFNGTVLQVTGGAGVPCFVAENTGAGANMIVNVTDGGAASLKAGTGQQQFKFDSGYNFAIASDTKANILAGTGSGTNRLTIHPTTGDVDIITGHLDVNSGNIIATVGDITATAGDVNATAGSFVGSDRVEVTKVLLKEKSSDPADPAEGTSAIWQSDGTGSGDDGDIMIKITAGAVTKIATLIDFSVV